MALINYPCKNVRITVLRMLTAYAAAYVISGFMSVVQDLESIC